MHCSKDAQPAHTHTSTSSTLCSRCKLSDYIIRQQLREIAEKIEDGAVARGEINSTVVGVTVNPPGWCTPKQQGYIKGLITTN